MKQKINYLDRPIHVASGQKDPELALMLINAGALLNERDSRSMTPLDKAVQSGNTLIAQKLIQGGASLILFPTNKNSWQYAKEFAGAKNIQDHLKEILLITLSSREIQFILDKMRAAWQDLAAQGNDTPEARKQINSEILENSLSTIVNAKIEYANQAYSPDLAAMYRNKVVQDALVQNTVKVLNDSINQPIVLPETILPRSKLSLNRRLWRAVSKSDVKEAERLINAGAQVNMTEKLFPDKILSDLNRTLLHQAVLQANPSMVVFLVQKGADVNAPDAEDETPLEFAVARDAQDPNSMRIRPVIIKTLIEHGADIHVNDNADIPLIQETINNKHFDDTKALIMAVSLKDVKPIIAGMLSLKRVGLPKDPRSIIRNKLYQDVIDKKLALLKHYLHIEPSPEIRQEIKESMLRALRNSYTYKPLNKEMHEHKN